MITRFASACRPIPEIMIYPYYIIPPIHAAEDCLSVYANGARFKVSLIGVSRLGGGSVSHPGHRVVSNVSDIFVTPTTCPIWFSTIVWVRFAHPMVDPASSNAWIDSIVTVVIRMAARVGRQVISH